MYNSKVRNDYVIVLLLAMSSTLSVADLPDVAMPSMVYMQDMELSWIAKKYFYNGYPMTIQAFKSPRHYEDVISYYQSIWRVQGAGKQVYRKVADTYYLAHEANGYSYSLQIKSSKQGSEGVLVTTLNRHFDLEVSKIPTTAVGKLISRTHSQDAEYVTESLVISSRNKVNINKSYYGRWFQQHHWIELDQIEKRQDKEVLYENNGRLCQINYLNKTDHSPGSLIVIHLMSMSAR